MKILIVMGGFLPGKKYGGPPISVNNFCSLMKEHDIYILTRNHDLGEKKPYSDVTDGWNYRENCTVKYLSDADYNKKSFENAILEIQPDYIYLQGVFQSCVIGCLRLAKKHGIRVILAPRGELCKGAMRKKYKKVPYLYFLRWSRLLKNVVYQSTSNEETKEIAKWLNVERERICLVENIPSLVKDGRIIGCEKEKGYARFVFISRIHPKKNLLTAIQCINKVDGKVKFDIYGPIEDRVYWEKCVDEIKKSPAHVDITYCGIAAHEKIHQIFSEYDAFVFPTMSENYGHVIAESLMAGCPVITSDETPWEKLEDNFAGWTIPLEDKQAYVDALQTIVDVDSGIFSYNAKKYAQSRIDFLVLKEKYNCLFNIM